MRLSDRETFVYRDPVPQKWFLVVSYLIVGVIAGFFAIITFAVAVPALYMPLCMVAIAGLIVAVRCIRFTTLRVDASGVTEYRPFRTRSWRWREIDRFGVEVRTLPFKVVQSRLLVLHERGGSTRLLDGITARPRSGPISWVNQCASELNERLRREPQANE